MSQITRWDPFRELDNFSNRLSTLFGDRLGVRSGEESNGWTRSDWAPAVDIVEDTNGYAITAELPQVNKEDVDVTVENGVLTIKGERKFERKEEDKDKKYHRVERAYGTFVRSFRVPTDADGTKIKAAYKDGVLTVTLPKSEAAAPKKIAIDAS